MTASLPTSFLCLIIANGLFGGDLRVAAEESDEDKAQRYLNAFGYLDGSGLQVAGFGPAGQSEVKASLEEGIRRLQAHVGLDETGELDEPTLKLISLRRCGVPDIRGASLRVFSIGSGSPRAIWDHNDLTWTIDDFTKDMTENDQWRAFRQAFAVWSSVTPLNFAEVATGETADIHIKFARAGHGDPFPFDGPGGVLAHAIFAPDGKVHFDDAEEWAFMDMDKLHNVDYSDLLAVAIHEIGHALGLEHSDDMDAIMAPFYHDQAATGRSYEVPELNMNDICRIQQLYGKRSIPIGQGGNKGATMDDVTPVDGNCPISRSRRRGGGFNFLQWLKNAFKALWKKIKFWE